MSRRLYFITIELQYHYILLAKILLTNISGCWEFQRRQARGGSAVTGRRSPIEKYIQNREPSNYITSLGQIISCIV